MGSIRKYTFILSACLFVGVIFMGFKMNNKKINMVPIQIDQAYLVDSLQDLEANCDIIVKARVLENPINETFETPGGLTFYGITYTDIEVVSVFLGDVSVGDKLNITEEYYCVDELTTRNIFHTENYGPSTIGQEYIFFLKEYFDSKFEFKGKYFPLGVEKGRYPILVEQNPLTRKRSSVNIDELTNEELNLGNENSTEYREIFEDVIKKYY